MRRRLGGRQPLCGMGVMSEMLEILMPSAFRARTEDSRPGPGPLMRTSSVLMPYSCATRPADSAATWAANGVDLREPLKPAPPDVAQDNALPWRSVIVMIVLLKDAWTCAMPSETLFLIFLRTRDAPVLEAFAIFYSSLISSGKQQRDAAPCGCGRWCGYADHARAGRAYGACLDKFPGRSDV